MHYLTFCLLQSAFIPLSQQTVLWKLFEIVGIVSKLVSEQQIWGIFLMMEGRVDELEHGNRGLVE